MIHSHAIQGHKVWTRVRVGQPDCGGTRAPMHPDPVASPYLPRQRQLRRLNSLAVPFYSRLRGVPSRLRIGDRLALLPRLVATNSKTPAGRRLSAFQSARLFRAVNFQSAHHIACKLADVPEHSFVAFRDARSSMTQHHLRGFQSAGNIFQKGR